MSYNYTQFVAALANLAGTQQTNPFFVIELPNAIDYAEQRIFRDLDLIATTVDDSSRMCTPGNRNIQVPAAYIQLNTVSIITPAGAVASNGMRNPLVNIAKPVLDLIYPSAALLGVPSFYYYEVQGYGAVNGNIIVGPWPDQPYLVMYSGFQRPLPLSATNLNTFLATYLPDLFLIAAMIHMCAYQKNWAATGNDPGASVTWESQYATLLNSANTEQLRVRYAGSITEPPHGFVPSAQGAR